MVRWREIPPRVPVKNLASQQALSWIRSRCRRVLIKVTQEVVEMDGHVDGDINGLSNGIGGVSI